MRVIAGKFKAKRLNGPKSENTRPTLDRVKEAVFSMLDNYIEGAVVLDLFAGSGALGIEAISRGANFVYFNDNKKEAVSTIISNLELTISKNYGKISLCDYAKSIKKLSDNNIKFDIIFIDPPYNTDLIKKSMDNIAKEKILKENGIIVCESDKDFNILNDEFKCVSEKKYGRVIIKLFKWG